MICNSCDGRGKGSLKDLCEGRSRCPAEVLGLPKLSCRGIPHDMCVRGDIGLEGVDFSFDPWVGWYPGGPGMLGSGNESKRTVQGPTLGSGQVEKGHCSSGCLIRAVSPEGGRGGRLVGKAQPCPICFWPQKVLSPYHLGQSCVFS